MSSTDYDDDYEGVDPAEDTSDDDVLDGVDVAASAEEGEVDAVAKVDSDGEGRPTPDDLAQAESLSPSAKRDIRQKLEDEVARFLAQGGQIHEVPADESIRD